MHGLGENGCDRWRWPRSSREGDTARAAELLAFVADHPFTSHETRERVRGLLRELEAELPPETFAAAVAAAGREELDEVVAEVVGAET